MKILKIYHILGKILIINNNINYIDGSNVPIYFIVSINFVILQDIQRILSNIIFI